MLLADLGVGKAVLQLLDADDDGFAPGGRALTLGSAKGLKAAPGAQTLGSTFGLCFTPRPVCLGAAARCCVTRLLRAPGT